jgi:hypothetical protein
MSKKIEIKNGDKYGFLTIIKEELPIKNTQNRMIRKFLCKCDCGLTSIPSIGDLRTGHTTSCGCKNEENRTKAITKHGMYGSVVYHTWMNLIQRCTNIKNSKYKDYGGRGIKVCKEWLKFENFFKDMGKPNTDNMTLERKNNNKGYNKNNCKWDTRKAQARNRRSSIFVNFRNEKKLMIELAEEFGLKYATLYGRLFISNWSVERALSNLTK